MTPTLIQSIINQYDFNLAYAKELVRDVSDDLMCAQPAKGLVNHPAFTLGHLVTGSALTAKYLGSAFEIPDGWESLFLRRGPGDPRYPETDKDLFPNKTDLILELERQHKKVKTLLLKVDQATLLADKKWWYSNYMPKLIDCINFMCIIHEAMHLSQLAAWRRAMNLDSALKKL
jgi:DinB superfamily